jgi:hypothetical protein
MGRTVFVSMMKCNWHTSLLTFPQRVHELEKLCKKSVPKVTGDKNPLHVVMAPEYTFRTNPAAVVRKATKTWHNGLDSSNNPKAGPDVFSAYKKSKETSTILSLMDREFLINSIKAATTGRDVLVIPGTIFWAQTDPMYKISSVLKKKTVTAPGIVRNTCDVIYSGRLIHTYSKLTDVHELDLFEAGAYTFMPGVNLGTFEISGLNVGVEICGDHGKMRSTMAARENPGSDEFEIQRKGISMTTSTGTDFGVDLHLLVSDGSFLASSNMAIRKGGFAAHTDATGFEDVRGRNAQGQYKKLTKTGDFFMFEYGVSDSFNQAKQALENNLKFKPAKKI